MQSIDPTLTVITGQARARGFVLEGYGIFFDVEVPHDVCECRVVDDDGPARYRSRCVARVAPPRPRVAPGGTEAAGSTAGAPDRLARQVGPIQQSREEPPTSPFPLSTRSWPPTRYAPLPPVMDDPDRQYTDAVKSALIDAMLDHSQVDGSRVRTNGSRSPHARAKDRSRRTSSSMWRRSFCA